MARQAVVDEGRRPATPAQAKAILTL
jgi:hypothetical protein